MIIIDQNLQELRESIVYLTTNCNGSDYPTEFQTYDEGWDSLRQSLDHLRRKLGDARYAQLIEMTEQAKAHYDDGYAMGPKPGVRPAPGDAGSEHIKLGSWLMQDIEQVVKGKPPFAYPEDLYRWPR
ncbi:hypothetical protein U8326_01100 [Tsuneonella sp. CC-YZS046]|uniref:hypothetical protein n=1 Tax=Tsuneonella sp. CC-YZS046 TaxID=3042152 RepID=UPI002D7A1E8A|nr:hypothetical protein [Tsuneonella sp. CC-YZS046]WRO66795.1 hypothetical protein U8326_01100 [Tsuneonella sp. CC-YZS046]